MLTSLYMFIVAIAVTLFIIGILESELSFLSMSVVLFLVAGFYSFHLTYISNGTVLTLNGAEWALAFIWWAFAMIGILAIALQGLSLRRRDVNA